MFERASSTQHHSPDIAGFEFHYTQILMARPHEIRTVHDLGTAMEQMAFLTVICAKAGTSQFGSAGVRCLHWIVGSRCFERLSFTCHNVDFSRLCGCYT